MAAEDSKNIKSPRTSCPSQPFGTTFFERLRLLSPKALSGIYQLLTDPNNPNAANGSVLFQAISSGFVLPLGVFGLANLICQKKQNLSHAVGGGLGRLYSIPFTLLVLCSPWSVLCLGHAIPELQKVIKGLSMLYAGRGVTLPSAEVTLHERIESDRAYRRRRYDVFLPSTHSSELQNVAEVRRQRGVVFIPGALVPHTAYAEIAARLSDAGLLVVVVSLEPVRMAHDSLGVDAASINRIQREVERQVEQRRLQSISSMKSDSTKSSSTEQKRIEWSVMGHSMGASAAMRLLPHVTGDSSNRNGRSRSDSSKAKKLDQELPQRLVLWGVGTMAHGKIDVSRLPNCQVLIVQGSEDQIVAFSKPYEAEFDALLPPSPKSTRREIIQGGSHMGFASYDNNKDYPNKYGSIARETQQELACAATAKFLLE